MKTTKNEDNQKLRQPKTKITKKQRQLKTKRTKKLINQAFEVSEPRHLIFWLSLGQATSIQTLPPVIFMFPCSNFKLMQIMRRGKRGTNPTVGSPY